MMTHPAARCGVFVYLTTTSWLEERKPNGMFDMGNTGWIVFLFLILGAIATDVILAQGANSVFLLKRLADLIEWVAFWR